MTRWSLGIDVGGTFVDLSAVSSAGERRVRKRALGADGPGGAVLAVLDEFLAAEGIAPASVDRLLHGTTVATNALLERRSPPVGVLLTEGFADILTLARQDRADLYARTVPPQPGQALFPEQLRHGIGGRMDAAGTELAPLDEKAVTEAGKALAAEGVQAIAVCFLHSPLNASHERRARELLAIAAPGVRVSLSCEVDPRPREYERALTTALDAYVAGAVAAYVRELEAGLKARGIVAPLLMRSEGGVASVEACLAVPLSLAMSGPAAAVNGLCALLDAEAKDGLAIGMDVGGTSTDFAVLEGGAPPFGESLRVGDLRLRVRSVDVHSIALGGGSVIAVDAVGGLRIGPRSMGAWPGPACFGRGGDRATLTDAFLVAGLLPETLAGGLALDRALASAALERDVARPLGLGVPDAALAALRVANAMLADAIKRVAVGRGADPREATLVAAGGGGGLHAAAAAQMAGARRVLVPPSPGLAAAHGLLGTAQTHSVERPVDLPLDTEAGRASLARVVRDLLAVAPPAQHPAYAAPKASVFVEACYAGQEFSLEIPLDPATDLSGDTLARRFDERHRRVRGQAFPNPRRVRAVRVVQQHAAPAVPPPPAGWRGEAMRGSGAVVLSSDDTTVVVPDGWTWSREPATGVLVLERS